MINPNSVVFAVNQCRTAYGNTPDGAVPISDGQSHPRGFAMLGKETAIIAIAGSESIVDWLIDGSAWKTDAFGAEVHAGFLTEHEKIWPQVHELLRRYPAGSKVTITGHSLGGAIATLLGYAAVDELELVPDVITFGSPRVGNWKFSRKFNKMVPNSLRVQHHDDLIPRVPKLGYVHVNQLLRLDDNGKELTFSGVRGIFERFEKIVEADLRGSAESDHKISGYVDATYQWGVQHF
jgi:Lipase (class 3)